MDDIHEQEETTEQQDTLTGDNDDTVSTERIVRNGLGRKFDIVVDILVSHGNQKI